MKCIFLLITKNRSNHIRVCLSDEAVQNNCCAFVRVVLIPSTWHGHGYLTFHRKRTTALERLVVTPDLCIKSKSGFNTFDMAWSRVSDVSSQTNYRIGTVSCYARFVYKKQEWF